MSVSSLREIEECPRRWALLRASYPQVWGGTGYPPRPARATLAGQVIHAAIERTLDALTVAGCSSVYDPSFVAILGGLGGFSAIVRACISEILKGFAGNPRVVRTRPALESWFEEQLPRLREQVKQLIARLDLYASPRKHGRDGPRTRSIAQQRGTYSEVPLYSAELQWRGVADVINVSAESVEIIDFKSGEPSDHYLWQLEVYSLLWLEDGSANPERRPVDRLLLSCPHGIVEVAVPDAHRRAELLIELRERAARAREALQASLPAAYPSQEYCGRCSVRHLCADYWQNIATISSVLRTSEAGMRTERIVGDLELDIGTERGRNSWNAAVSTSAVLPRGAAAIVRLGGSDPTFVTVLGQNRRVRVLGAVVTDEPTLDGGLPVVHIGQFSEVFLAN